MLDGFQGITTEADRNDIVTKTDEALGRVQDAVADPPDQSPGDPRA